MLDHSIRKYLVPTGLGLSVEWPSDAKVLHVHEQAGEVCMWVSGTWDLPLSDRRRRFVLVITGSPIPPQWGYVGTAHLSRIGLVAHVFEVMHD